MNEITTTPPLNVTTVNMPAWVRSYPLNVVYGYFEKTANNKPIDNIMYNWQPLPRMPLPANLLRTI